MSVTSESSGGWVADTLQTSGVYAKEVEGLAVAPEGKIYWRVVVMMVRHQDHYNITDWTPIGGTWVDSAGLYATFGPGSTIYLDAGFKMLCTSDEIKPIKQGTGMSSNRQVFEWLSDWTLVEDDGST